MKIEEYVDVKNYSTFRVGGQFRYFVIIKKQEDLSQIYAIAQKYGNQKDYPILILGGGSNIIFSDGVIDRFVIKMEIKGFEIIKETDDDVFVKVGAGEIWDDFVKESIKNNFSGVEAMSIIPGTVGAGPVQNVGAYGVEVKDILDEVIVYDLKEEKIKNLSNSDCDFSYRDSLFKKDKGRYVILYVVYKLSKQKPKIPNYPDVLKYFEERGVKEPNLNDIRQAIISIRNSKLPDFKILPNVGSFFKNPIVDHKTFSSISPSYGEIPNFKVGDNLIKIPAGWLIEKAGLKGKSFGNISVYDKSALVLVNNGHATFSDLLNTKEQIVKIVFDKFGIKLEQEPEIL